MQLIQGDCLEILKTIPEHSIDLILTDPPYGSTSCSWDIVIPFEQMWEQFHRVIKKNGAILIFGQEPFSSLLRCSNLQEYKYDLYWEKERLTNIPQVKKRYGKTIETISVFYAEQPTYNPQMRKYDGPPRSNGQGKGVLYSELADGVKTKIVPYQDNGLRYPTQLLHYPRDIRSKLHPTQKPIALLKELIKAFTNEGDLVLDSCMGSGSTGVAALETNRDFIGIEKDEKYFEISKNRISSI